MDGPCTARCKLGAVILMRNALSRQAAPYEGRSSVRERLPLDQSVRVAELVSHLSQRPSRAPGRWKPPERLPVPRLSTSRARAFRVAEAALAEGAGGRGPKRCLGVRRRSVGTRNGLFALVEILNTGTAPAKAAMRGSEDWRSTWSGPPMTRQCWSGDDKTLIIA